MFRSAFNSVRNMIQRDLTKSETQIYRVNSRTTIDSRQQTSQNISSATKGSVYQLESENEEPVPFSSLFRFASKTDIVLIIVSLAASLVNGFCFPISVILFGRLSAAFVEFDQAEYSSTLDAPNLTVITVSNADTTLNL